MAQTHSDDFVQYKASNNEQDNEFFGDFLIARTIQDLKGFVEIYGRVEANNNDVIRNVVTKVINELNNEMQGEKPFSAIKDQELGALDYNILKRFLSDVHKISASSGLYVNARIDKLPKDRIKHFYSSLEQFLGATENLVTSFVTKNQKVNSNNQGEKRKNTIVESDEDTEIEEEIKIPKKKKLTKRR